MPVAARNFTHGSIANRVRHLHNLSADPVRTIQFDRTMALIYALMSAILIGCGAWVLVMWAA